MSWKNTGQTDEFKIWSDVCLYMIIPSNRMIIYHPSPFWKKSKTTLLWYFEIAMEIALLVRWFTYAMWFLSIARCSKLPECIHHIVPNYHITGDTSNEIHSAYIIYIWHLYIYIDIIHPIYWQFPVTLLLQVTKTMLIC